MEKIQEILFENKESIPNGIYLELMDELKKIYITRNDNELVKITYTRIRPVFSKNTGEYGYNIDLTTATGMSVIIKKSDFNFQYENGYGNEIKLIDAIPFIPFWTEKKSFFNDYGYEDDTIHIFKSIKRNEPEDTDGDDDWDDERDDEENKRKIKFQIQLNYSIKYLITNVEKLN